MGCPVPTAGPHHGRVASFDATRGLGAVDDEVTLTVKDDGIGFPADVEGSAGMGLNIMNYRAKMIGASLDIRRGVGGGTIVLCSFHNENLTVADQPRPPAKAAPMPRLTS